MDLTEFLSARLNEDEAVARGADWDEPWRVDDSKRLIRVMAGDWRIASASEGCGATHIARHDPARVLADVAAKRLLVKHRATSAAASTHESLLRNADYILRVLASPYADHPDFDPAWRA